MRRLKPIDSISENDYIHFLPTLSTAAAHTNVGFLLHDPCMLATITVCLTKRSVRPLSSTTAFLSGGYIEGQKCDEKWMLLSQKTPDA